jgi:hypothetical protein
LNEDLLTAGEMILHVGEPTVVTTGAAPAPAATRTAAALHADIDKRGLHSGQNSFNPPEIDVAYDSL